MVASSKLELVFVLITENAFSYRFHFKANRKSIGFSLCLCSLKSLTKKQYSCTSLVSWFFVGRLSSPFSEIEFLRYFLTLDETSSILFCSNFLLLSLYSLSSTIIVLFEKSFSSAFILIERPVILFQKW